MITLDPRHKQLLRLSQEALYGNMMSALACSKFEAVATLKGWLCLFFVNEVVAIKHNGTPTYSHPHSVEGPPTPDF